jgi:hypothetical protein
MPSNPPPPKLKDQRRLKGIEIGRETGMGIKKARIRWCIQRVMRLYQGTQVRERRKEPRTMRNALYSKQLGRKPGNKLATSYFVQCREVKKWLRLVTIANQQLNMAYSNSVY